MDKTDNCQTESESVIKPVWLYNLESIDMKDSKAQALICRNAIKSYGNDRIDVYGYDTFSISKVSSTLAA